MKAFTALLVSTALLALGGCRDGSPRLSPTRGYLLISIDTLRADHLGAYGYERPTSPFLDSLAARGVLFENAVAQMPSTLPSHLSMLTGLYPAEHAVMPPDGYLPPSIPTLAERFRAAGFATAGFTEGGYMAGRYGFSRGFEVFDDSTRHHLGVPTPTFWLGLDFLRRLEPEDDYFLLLHTYAVHDPYDPPKPYLERYWPEEPPQTFEPTGENFSRFLCGHETLTAEAPAYYTALYDAGINYLDDQLRRLFHELECLGLSDDLTVVITSDHGEELGEHGGLSHQQVYHHNLHVPLIVLHPGLTAGRERRLVQLVDLAPTLLELAGLEPFEAISGTSLVPLLAGAPGEGPAEAPREAFGSSGVVPSRTIYRQQGDRLYRLLKSRAFYDSAGSGELWVTPRGISLDVSEPRLRFDALSFVEPRVLEVAVDGRVLEQVELGTDWQPVDLELPADRSKHVVSLTAEDCLPATVVGAQGDCRCLSFRVRGLDVSRDELYAVHSDPAEAVDLSAVEVDLATGLRARLDGATFSPAAEAEREPLDPALEEQLRALGYIQ